MFTVEKFYTFAFIAVVVGIFIFIEFRARKDVSAAKKLRRRKSRARVAKVEPPVDQQEQ